VLLLIYPTSRPSINCATDSRSCGSLRLGLGGCRVGQSHDLAVRLLLSKAAGERKLFDAFNQQLLARGLMAKEDIKVDAAFAEVPRQRSTRKENAQIKNNQTPEAWKNNRANSREKTWTAR
jgi:hypothetical protein